MENPILQEPPTPSSPTTPSLFAQVREILQDDYSDEYFPEPLKMGQASQRCRSSAEETRNRLDMRNVVEEKRNPFRSLFAMIARIWEEDEMRKWAGDVVRKELDRLAAEDAKDKARGR